VLDAEVLAAAGENTGITSMTGLDDDGIPVAKVDGAAPIASPTFTTQITTPIIALTGGQIAFPATAVPSSDPNTLDDYEEGTYTVTLTCGTSGTITIDTSEDTLSYVKIGSLFAFQGYLSIASVSSPAGTLIINGMPFTSSILAENSGKAAVNVGIFATSSDSDGAPMGTISEGTTIITVLEQTRAGTGATIAGFIDGGTIMYIGGSYRVSN